jgi:amino acid adenylation domain-containing protein
MMSDVVEGFRFSPQQERLWLLPGGGGRDLYCAFCRVRISGFLDPKALAAAARSVVERHEILRTVFRSLPGTSVPVQVVLSEPALSFRALDLSALGADEREAWLQELRREALGAFDLENGPVLRLILATLAPADHHLFVALPSLCADVVALASLVRQLGQAYDSPGAAGEPLQYADLADFFNELLEAKEMAAGREYWLERELAVRDEIELLPPGGSATHAFSPAIFVISDPLRTLPEDLVRSSTMPLSTVLLGAWATFIWRLTGRPEIAVAAVHDGRSYEGLEDVLGLFARYLPLTFRFSPEMSFVDVLVELERERESAGLWQGSFSLRRLEKERAAGAPVPAFSLGFSFQEAPVAQTYGAIRFAVEEIGATIELSRIELICTATSERVTLRLQLSPGTCSPLAARRLLGQLVALLEDAATRPSQRIGELAILPEAERHLLRCELNDTDLTFAEEPLLHEMFARQCGKTPEAVAVVEESGRSLTFAELDRRASRLAGRLRQHGVGMGDLVGVGLDRSLAMVVAVLGVLKAGAAYLPLDPGYPQDRLSFMVGDARPRLILTRDSLRQNFEFHGVSLLILFEDPGSEAAEGSGAPAASVSPDTLAYVIYTSGSTGRPKGVAVSHRAISNRLLWMQQRCPVGPEDGIVFKTAFGFDASIWELFIPLITGARLIVARPGGQQDSAYLVRLVREQQATILQLVPSMLQIVVEEPGLPECASLRRLFCGGEAFPGELQRRFLSRHGAELHNLYGPTEAAIDTTHWACQPDDVSTVLPLGRPLANVRVHLLSAQLEPMPAGIPGELYIGGTGLARGYLNRPDLTAERFLPDAQSGRPGERLYRTGDLARYRTDGILEFLGRTDQQVKIRGFRIELGEIEAALARHPAVSQSAVVVRSGDRGDRLLGYVVLSGSSVEAADLRAFLATSLPDYMLPAVIVALPALPVLPNGKIDRSSLPEPRSSELTVVSKEVPRNLTEEVLVGIWSDVLGAPGIGIRDSFFDLGGHSISATQMAARVRQAFGVDLSLRTFFDRPTIAELAEAVEGVRRAGQVDSPATPQPIPRDGRTPLSFAQHRLWFLDQLQPGNPAYNIGLGFRLRGNLNLPALAAALSTVVWRHEILRTVFSSAQGEPAQIAGTSSGIEIPAVDLKDLPETARASVLQSLAAEAAQRPFDLSRGPLMRALLVRTAPAEHTVILMLHHIVTDGWSTRILLGEIVELYQAAVQQRRADLPDLPVQYADFAAWQLEWLRGEVLDSQLAYWQQRLAGLPVLQLPTDYPRPALQTFRGATQPVLLSVATLERLAVLGRRRGASLFMTLMAAFDLFLARLTGSRDIAVGFPVAGRTRPEVENLIGLFVNTLVLRTDLSGAPGFEQIVERVQGEVLVASAFQELPFEKLVESLQVERDLSQNPLFPVMLILQNRPRRDLEIEGLTLSTLPVDTGTAKFDLSLDLVETANGLVGALEYNSDLFAAATMARWARHFVNLVEAALVSPARPFVELDLLGEAERRQILADWNATGTPYRLRPLHRLVEEQVARTPEAIALVYGEDRLTYAELDRLAGLWADHLRGLGVGPDVPVGICCERSLEMVIGPLAILKAGGAYLPLDPSYPTERLAFVLRDAGLRLVLTQQRLLAGLPEGSDYLCLETPPWSGEPETAPAGADIDLANLAYVIYTSGSTGFPKGAMISHGGIANRLLWMQEAYRLGADDKVLQKTPYTFDVSVWEFFWPLLAGATLVVARPEGHRDSAYLASLIATEQITTVHFVPSMLQIFLEEPKAADCRSLRRILCSGESLPVEVSNRCLARFASFGTELHNLYGPTEASVDVSFWACRPAERLPATPIGKPIANLRLQIVDADFQPVPVGVPGELLIGGIGLGRGYLGRPDLTAERFVPDPFSGESGGRLYRTGDLARFLPGGDVDFRGRIDFQVKIRGFRIELGEIEAALERHRAVLQAVVVTLEVAGDQRLVAYVVPADGEAPQPAALRVALAETLPEYMVPAAIVLLEAFPLSANGKVNRRALSPPETLQDDRGDPSAPRTPVEEILAGLWERLLGRSPIGRNESFFNLGGHSLLATQILSRVRDDLGVELALRTFFEKPTLAELADAIESARGLRQRAVPPLRPRSRDGVLPLSFAQERVWFVEQLVPDNPVYNISLVFGLLGELNVPALAAAFSEIVRRHEALRTTFRERDGAPVQIVGPASPVPAPVIDLSGLVETLRPEVSRRLQVEEARRAFDLTRGPLLRIRLLRLSAAEYVVFFTVHHIVSDAWSMDLFGRELAAHYAACVAGMASTLPELPVQYADYAAWQRECLTGEVLQQELGVWAARLAGLPNLDLPVDSTRPPVQAFHGGRRSQVLPDGTVERLRALGSASGVTPFMALLAVFEALVGRYSSQQDAGIGFPIANRRWTEVEPVIGFFVNILVLRMDLAGDPPFSELLKRVRETALDAYMHQDVPFELLVSHLQPERDLSRNPLVQVAFQWHQSPGGQEEMPGLALSRPQQEGTVVRFDLEMVVSEVAGRLLTHLDYSSDLFEDATAARMLSHFENLVAASLDDPASRISNLTLLSPGEREQLLRVWNRPSSVGTGAETLVGIFEAQAALRPAAPAVAFDLDEMTYGELNAVANRLAHHLRSLGVGPESRVGVCTERALSMIVGLLAVLKAGGAYVPLDPVYPRERLGYMMGDSKITVLLAPPGLAAELPRHDVPVVALDAPASWNGSEENLRPLAVPDSLAYVIYTSGSTGRPKGVMVTHRHVVRLFAATRGWFGFNEEDTWTLFHSYAFDFSVWEIWGALLHGGRLVVVPYWVSRSPEAFQKLIAGEGVTVLNQTPSAFQELVRIEGETGPTDPQGRLRLVIFGGEALSLSALAPWFERHGDRRPLLVNMYGITETTVHVTHRPVSATDLRSGASPIGVPIPDLQVHVVDRALTLAPVGVPGEMLVGGGGVARGYLDRPGLTAERFVPDPFSSLPGARLYRSGDLARRGPDGALEYLGRIDHQVKIRGFRIELGEIASLLSSHPEVEAALADLRHDPASGPQIVAYLVPRGTRSEGLVADLRSYARRYLPEYMVPASFAILEEIPLTAHGKVDRRALAALQKTSGEEAVHAAPRTPIEVLLAGVWCELLGREKVGIDESFFDLGGHSLLAAQLMARLRQLCGVELPLRTLFEEPTLGRFAQRVEQALAAGTELAPAPPLEALPRTGDLPLSFGQERIWFLDQMSPGAFHNIPLGLRLTGRLRPELLRPAVEQVVSRHESLRTVFRRMPRGVAQVVLPPGLFELPRVDLRALPEGRREAVVQQLAALQWRLPFDLAAGPLVRLALLQVSEDQHVVVLTMHHIISDGWSLDVFVHEVVELYRGFVAGEPTFLEPLPIQYADYARWQRRWLDSEALAVLMGYWRGELGDAPPVLELPTDRPRGAIQSGRGHTLYFELPEELLAALKALGAKQGVTLFMTLLSALQVLLSRYAGQSEFAVGTPIAGRNRVEVENLIGLFINTLALPARLAGDPTGTELLARVRESVLGAYAHQELPFEKLVEALRPSRSLSYSPLFQVLMILQNTPRSAVQLPDLRLTRFDSDTGTARFDLTLALLEDDRRLHLALEGDSALFDASSLRRLAGHFQALLTGLTEAPEQRLSQLLFLTGSEEQALLEWNATTEESWNRPVHELIARQAALRPDAIAITCAGAAITYRQLEERAEGLGRRLARLGAGPGVPVALACGRSIEMAVGLLGIWKAGSAYVPLDPDYPFERLAHMIADSGAGVLVTQEGLRESLPLVASWTRGVVALDPGGMSMALDPVEDRAPWRRSPFVEDLAYIIYTSGSTGGPKGVEIPHRALANFLWSMHRQPGLGPDDVQAAVTSISFDVSCIDLWLPLVSGAQIVLATREECNDGRLLRVLLEGCGATALQATPTTWRLLLDAGWQGREGFRIQCGGEALPPPLASELCRQPGTFWHLYGPTETTVWSTAGPLAAGDPLNVGHPIANTEIYILDIWGNPQPPGVAGELLIGGSGLARGYHARPELTADRFVPDRFSDRRGGRLYRTGDLARYRADGRLEILGRIDHQLKVRGFRIEPGEIEAALTRHPALREAAVVGREVGGGAALVAYVVAGGAPAPGADELRFFLRQSLPDYMMPSIFMVLETLPRSPNGKIDRRALPAVDGRRPELATAFATPDTEKEKTVAAIWRDVLGVAEVGLHDNFFDLGGHSLLVVQVQGRLAEELGVTLPIVEMFRQVTVSTLAAYLEAARRPPEGDGVDLGASLERATARQAAQARRRRARATHLSEEPE